jgi:long-subunit acyl-CoA synthetase (AMP-forming)
MIVHPDTLNTALSAADAYGISPERIVLFDGESGSTHASNHHTVGDLIKQGLSKADPTFVERRLQPGEAKTKLAFLCFSSGTSGKPKVCPCFDSNIGWNTGVIVGRCYLSLFSDSGCHSNRCS